LADTDVMSVVAVAGSAASLNCSSSSSSNQTRWNYVDYGHKTPVAIYNGDTINAGFVSLVFPPTATEYKMLS